MVALSPVIFVVVVVLSGRWLVGTSLLSRKALVGVSSLGVSVCPRALFSVPGSDGKDKEHLGRRDAGGVRFVHPYDQKRCWGCVPVVASPTGVP